MAEKRRIAEPNKDENWVIAGSQIITEKAKDRGLSKEGRSEIANNLMEEIAKQIDEKGVVLIKAESNQVTRDDRGTIVERRNEEGKILTTTKKKEDAGKEID